MPNNCLSFQRYAKVAKAMQSDPRLQKLLSKPSEWIGKHGQTGEMFSKEVVDVTAAIHATGNNVAAMKPHQIVHFATDMLVLKAIPPVAVSAATAVAPATATPSLEPVEKSKPEPKRPKRKAAPAPEVSAEVAEDNVSDEELALTPRTRATARRSKAEATAFVPDTPKIENNGSARRPAAFVRPNVPFIPGCAILSNFQAAAVILESYATTDPEARAILERINSLIDDVHRKTVMPNCAQENAKSS